MYSDPMGPSFAVFTWTEEQSATKMSSLYIRTVGKIVVINSSNPNSFPQLIYVKMFKDDIWILSPWLFASRTYCVRSMHVSLPKKASGPRSTELPLVVQKSPRKQDWVCKQTLQKYDYFFVFNVKEDRMTLLQSR